MAEVTTAMSATEKRELIRWLQEGTGAHPVNRRVTFESVEGGGVLVRMLTYGDPHPSDDSAVTRAMKFVENYGVPSQQAPGDRDLTTDQLALRLSMHLVSEHCDSMALGRPLSENLEEHTHEHTGPGTIRNHDPGDYKWSAAKVQAVLAEAHDG